MAESDQKSNDIKRDPLDQFQTRARRDVISNLLDMSRAVEPLTILFDGGKESFPTSIIGLISDNSTVVFERASSEAMNQKLLQHKTGTIIGQPEGIKVRFTLEDIEAAEHEGEKVLVAPLPKEHYRMQRRRLFRINTLIREPVEVTISLSEDHQITLNAGNISSGGLRLDDVNGELSVKQNQALPNCQIQIPDVEPFQVDLRVRNSYEKVKKNGVSVTYIGCAFENMLAEHERHIQNYINNLQRAQRALAK